jgi:hypothetical protein
MFKKLKEWILNKILKRDYTMTYVMGVDIYGTEYGYKKEGYRDKSGQIHISKVTLFE